jgi:NAD dependent epimerase/dehydratase family enzyme
MREINFMKRSGFNQHIDDMSKNNLIGKPISEKKQKLRTLRKNTTKNLIYLVKQQESPARSLNDASEEELTIT